MSESVTTETDNSTDQVHLCGICKKAVPEKNTQEGESFTKTCPLCKIVYYHCMQCVKKYANGFNQKGTMTNVSIEDFEQSKVSYYCKSCEDLKCPNCDKRHQRSKYNILIFLKFLLLH